MQGLETVTHHRTTQDHTVVKLLCRQTVTGLILERIWVAAEVGMTLLAKPVERSTHVSLFLLIHVKERQVKRGTTGMSATLYDILLGKSMLLSRSG